MSAQAPEHLVSTTTALGRSPAPVPPAPGRGCGRRGSLAHWVSWQSSLGSQDFGEARADERIPSLNEHPNCGSAGLPPRPKATSSLNPQSLQPQARRSSLGFASTGPAARHPGGWALLGFVLAWDHCGGVARGVVGHGWALGKRSQASLGNEPPRTLTRSSTAHPGSRRT